MDLIAIAYVETDAVADTTTSGETDFVSRALCLDFQVEKSGSLANAFTNSEDDANYIVIVDGVYVAVVDSDIVGM